MKTNENRDKALAALRLAALRETVLTYGQLAFAIGWASGSGRGLGPVLSAVGHYCEERGLPPLYALVVKKDTRLPSRASRWWNVGDRRQRVIQMQARCFAWARD